MKTRQHSIRRRLIATVVLSQLLLALGLVLAGVFYTQRRLLAALDAGLDPEFVVLDEQDAAELRRGAFDAALGALRLFSPDASTRLAAACRAAFDISAIHPKHIAHVGKKMQHCVLRQCCHFKLFAKSHHVFRRFIQHWFARPNHSR